MNPIITHLFVNENITLITLMNIPYDMTSKEKIFSALAKSNVNIDMVSLTTPLTGTIDISFSIQDEDLFTAIQTLKAFKATIPQLRIQVNSNNSKISLYGELMRTSTGVFAETLQVFVENNVEIKMITTSEVDISYLIYSSDQPKAVKAIKEYYKL
jgi:aspartokinase